MRIRIDYEFGNIKFSQEGDIIYVEGDNIYYKIGDQTFILNKNAKNYKIIGD